MPASTALRSWRLTIALVFSLGSVATGCTTSRTLTPWLRTYSRTPFTLFAESGNSSQHGDAWIERRIGGRWIVSRDFPAEGFGFANDTRAVLGNALLTDGGQTMQLACDGRGIGNGLRATPRGELLCIEVRDFFESDVAPADRETVRVVRYDNAGIVLSERQVPLPIRRPEGAPPLSLSIDTGVVGFLGDQIVFSVLESRQAESWASDEWKRCDAYALSPAGQWHLLGTMRFQAGAIWMIHSAPHWRAALGMPIEAGAYARGT